MFSLNGVTLRPLEFDDIDQLYDWDSDSELEMLAGWGPKRSRAAYRQSERESPRLRKRGMKRRSFSGGWCGSSCDGAAKEA